MADANKEAGRKGGMPAAAPLHRYRSHTCGELRQGDVVILDNLSIHLGPRVKEVIERRSCQLLFLPAYSPDFSPIEEAFSKLKIILRRAGARTREALQEAIIEALPRITAQDALGWFLHCGYPAPSAGTQLNL